MSEIELIEQQRQLLRAFRQVTSQRAQAEADSAARYEAERAAADAALSQARQEAEKQRSAAEASATSHRKAEQQAADTALSQARQTADAHLSAVHKAQEEAEALLEEAGLQTLWGQAGVHPPDAKPGDDPAQKLAQSAAKSKEASGLLPSLVEALHTERKNSRQRRQFFATAGVVGLVVIILGGYAAFVNWQEQQEIRRAQATATALAPAVQATATAEAVAAEATATAIAPAVHATATAEAEAFASCNLSGKWRVRFGLGPGNEVEHIVTFTQTGSRIEAISSKGWVFAGTIDGTKVEMDGREPTTGLTLHQSGLLSDCDTMHGTWLQSNSQGTTWTGARVR